MVLCSVEVICASLPQVLQYLKPTARYRLSVYPLSLESPQLKKAGYLGVVLKEMSAWCDTLPNFGCICVYLLGTLRGNNKKDVLKGNYTILTLLFEILEDLNPPL